MYVMEMAHTV